jgi:polyribonucleotide nucleotidyltransferase
MFNITKKSMQWGEETLTLETGRVARQADGSVIATLGETSVMANVTFAKEPKPGMDFFPLTVHYQEKYYAAGKVPGGFFKREARPSEKETLTARLIDRPIRPLFVPGFKNETLVMCTVLSHDLVNDPDMVAMIAASAALTISGAPFRGPIAGCRVGYEDGEYILNPTVDDMHDLRNNPDQRLDLVVAGTKNAVMMVESEAYELTEEEMLGAVNFAHQQIQPVIDLIIDLAEDAAKEPFDFQAPDYSALYEVVKAAGEDQMRAAYAILDKQERQTAVAAAKQAIKDGLTEEQLEDPNLGAALKKLESTVLRSDVVKNGRRIDGRALDAVRAIDCQTSVLPRTHGSALFTRGETQGLVVTTLGTGDDEQFIDALHGTFKQNFLLHYNFPPYSVGEAGRVGPPGRREIGHGKLAWRALQAVLPAPTDFPYTIRVVSEITESNGSSSMASVCGGSLSMMDAGVPLKAPVAGVAMGLVKEGDDFAVLTDILGDEDHLGDMDFKVAGTEDGITALQMDIKIQGITREIMSTALDQARDGRLHILGEMNKIIGESRSEMSEWAPTIMTIKIDPDKIRDVIGKGGAVIRAITEETGASVDIENDGTIRIASVDGASGKEALRRIELITADVEVGRIYEGKVARLMDFGAFVTILPGKDGLVHISQISNERVEKVSDKLAEGDVVKVKVLEVDRQGRVRLSMKEVDAA